MTTAVTGAAGHIGSNLVRALLAEGRKVRVLVRRDRRALEGLDVETVEGDIFDPAALARFLKGAGVLYHLAGRISIVGPEGGLVERTNVEGVMNVVQACLDAGVRRLVHCSSIHAFSNDPDDAMIDETRDLAVGPHDLHYDRSKAMGQIAALEGVSRGLDAVVINPGAVVGPFDYKVSRMGEVFLDIYHHRLPVLVDGGYNWVDARDVAQGAILAEKKGRTGHCYLLTGHWVHIREVSRLIGEVTGRKTPRAAVPLWAASAASYFSLGWGRLMGRTPKFTPAAVVAIQTHRNISHEKATRELGYRPRPFEETVRDPETVMGGQYSLPFTAAVALTRDMSNPLVYDDAAVKDPLVRSLAQNMELIVDKSVHDLFPAEVTIVCGDKTYKKVTSAHKGSPHNPLTWADACEKFSRYTRTLMAEPQARAIMEAVGDLENQGDMARVATLLASQ